MLIQCLHGSHLFIYYAFSTDFIAHSDHQYVFTNETNELPIATELVEDLLAEDDEAINICLPNLRDYTMAELADPDCVRVTINDNDRKKHYFSLAMHMHENSVYRFVSSATNPKPNFLGTTIPLPVQANLISAKGRTITSVYRCLALRTSGACNGLISQCQAEGTKDSHPLPPLGLGLGLRWT